MKTVHLSLGQSTIIRFPEEPKKVIVGNSNYFNVEFVGTDVAIQPKGKTNSNLFVYGHERTYGLLLKVNASKSYDDWVHVQWLKQKFNIAQDKILNLKVNLQNIAWIHLGSIHYLKHHDVYVIDLSCKSNSPKSIWTKDLGISLTRRKKELSYSPTLVWDQQKIKQGKQTHGRIIFKLKRKEAFTLHFSIKGKTSKTIIKRSFL